MALGHQRREKGELRDVVGHGQRAEGEDKDVEQAQIQQGMQGQKGGQP
jgi:hypothetical protein